MVMPQMVLEKAMNKKISLLLKDSRILEGKLVGFDEFMNLVLDETEETVGENKRRLNTVMRNFWFYNDVNSYEDNWDLLAQKLGQGAG